MLRSLSAEKPQMLIGCGVHRLGGSRKRGGPSRSKFNVRRAALITLGLFAVVLLLVVLATMMLRGLAFRFRY